MKRIFALLILTITLTAAQAQVKHVLTKSTIAFKIKNMGIGTGGSIDAIQTDIDFAKDKPEASSISATADMKSINTDNEMRDGHLRGEEYFNVAKYPTITMKSVAIKHKSGNNYVGTFNVTIKDKTKTVDVPFSYVQTGANAEFKGSFKISRLDFGVGGKSLVLGDDVTIEIDIQTTSS